MINFAILILQVPHSLIHIYTVVSKAVNQAVYHQKVQPMPLRLNIFNAHNNVGIVIVTLIAWQIMRLIKFVNKIANNVELPKKNLIT